MMSESVKELATALAKAQAQLKPATKDSINPHFKSKYADLGAIWDACRKVLTDHGLSVVQMPTDSTEGRVALTTVLMHTSGEYIGSTCSTRLQQDSAQGVGSALTYLRRYALAALVGIVADEDDDGNSASQPAQRPQEQRPAQAARQPAAPRPPTAAPAPANGTKRPRTRAEIEARFDEMIDEATALGIVIADESTDGKTDAQVIAAGKNLAELIAAAKQEKPGAVSKTAQIPVRQRAVEDLL